MQSHPYIYVLIYVALIREKMRGAHRERSAYRHPRRSQPLGDYVGQEQAEKLQRSRYTTTWYLRNAKFSSMAGVELGKNVFC